MDETEYKLMTEELKKELTDNKKKVRINEEKAELVRLNSLEHQAMRTFGFSLIPYISLIVTTCANDNFAAMTGATISDEFLPSVFMLSSLGIGTVINKIFKQNSKKRALFESFSEAKTDTEKIYERVKYTIEQEKALNRNKALEKAMNSIKTEQTLLEELSEKYEFYKKNISNSEEEVQKDLEKLSAFLEEKYNLLDIYSTQKILHEVSWKSRTKGIVVIEGLMKSFLSVFYELPLYSIPIMASYDYIHFGSFNSVVAGVTAPLVLCSGTAMGYKLKNSADYKKAFNNINPSLGEYSLPEKIGDAFEEQQNIDKKIDSTIKEIAAILSGIQEYKRNLELLSNRGLSII